MINDEFLDPLSILIKKTVQVSDYSSFIIHNSSFKNLSLRYSSFIIYHSSFKKLKFFYEKDK